jgi:hypothetical protein
MLISVPIFEFLMFLGSESDPDRRSCIWERVTIEIDDQFKLRNERFLKPVQRQADVLFAPFSNLGPAMTITAVSGNGLRPRFC